MEMKKLLRSGLAILCIVSMMFGYFAELAPAAKAEAAETTATLPTGFNEVTPREFGIADFSGNTEKASYTSSLNPLQSANKMLFKAKVVFGSGTLSLLDKNLSTSTLEGLNFWKNGSSAIRFNCNYTKIHVGGYYNEEGVYTDGQIGLYADGTSPYIYDMYPTLPAGTTSATAEFSMAITTEVVNFNGGMTANDLKVGVWFDGKLYNNTYFYLCDYIFTQDNIIMTATVDSITSPEITKPENPFTEVTPREFGIADFSGNTETITYTSSLKPIQTANQVMVKANIVFGSGGIYVFDNSGTGTIGNGINIKITYGQVRLSNVWSKIYVGDEAYTDDVEDKYYYDMNPLAGTGKSYDTEELSFTLTIEIVNYDGDTSANDLKLGIFYNGDLYNNAYVYLRNVTIGSSNIFLGTTALSVTSPAITAKSQWDGYKIVTPSTFGIEDYETDVATEIHQTEALASGGYETFNIDGVVFNSKVDFVVNGASTSIAYLYDTSGSYGLEIERNQSSTMLRIHNNFTGKKMYIGGEFTDPETYVDTAQLSATNPIEKGSYMALDPTKTELGSYGFQLNEFLLSVSTELIDFDKDEKKDDLRLGIWINGTLYQNCYFYVVDYENDVCQRRLYTKGVLKSTSFNMEPDDLGLTSGEYGVSDGTVIGASKVATSKIMNGTTLETDIAFNGVGASLLYGCNAEDTSKAFRLTSTEEGIKVSHTYNGTEEQIGLLTNNLLGTLLINNKFHLKLTTEVVNIDGGTEADDVLLSIQVNDKKLGYFAANVATQLTGRTGVECTGDATITIGSFASDTIEEVYHCLNDAAYTLSSTDGISRLSVNGTVVTEDTLTLDTPGTYSMVSTQNRLIHRQKVVLYNRYDVNESQTVDVKDLVRMLKVANDETQAETIASLSKAGKLAIAYEGEDKWTNDNAVHVLDFMREALVGAGAEAKQTGVAELMNRTELEKFENKHGAFTGNFTFTLDLENIDRVTTDQENPMIWILSTNAKYISVDGSYPTIKFRLIKENGSQLYSSHTYKVGEKNEYVERQWRVPMTLADYTTLEVNFVVPDGVALYIDELADLDNVVGEVSTEDETVYSGDNNVKYLAHSGFMQYAPDNTLLSFEAAGKMGFKSLITIPKFVKVSEDSDEIQGICLHDDLIKDTNLRYTNGDRITDTTILERDINTFLYSELEQFDAGIYKGEAFSSPIPTLEEYFRICKKYKMAPVFSTHPELTVEQCEYVKEMLHREEFLEEDGEAWLYKNLQIKAGGSKIGIDNPLSVFGFEIGGYIFIQPSNYSAASIPDVLYKTQLVAKAEEAGINLFDKVTVEIFDYSNHATETVEYKIAYVKDMGFTRISLAPNGNAEEPGFSSEKQRYYMNLGVNSFTVDYHCSMGLNW